MERLKVHHQVHMRASGLRHEIYQGLPYKDDEKKPPAGPGGKGPSSGGSSPGDNSKAKEMSDEEHKARDWEEMERRVRETIQTRALAALPSPSQHPTANAAQIRSNAPQSPYRMQVAQGARLTSEDLSTPQSEMPQHHGRPAPEPVQTKDASLEDRFKKLRSA